MTIRNQHPLDRIKLFPLQSLLLQKRRIYGIIEIVTFSNKRRHFYSTLSFKKAVLQDR